MVAENPSYNTNPDRPGFPSYALGLGLGRGLGLELGLGLGLAGGGA